MSELFDREYYRKQIRSIWAKKYIPLLDLAEDIGISFVTLKKIIEGIDEPISYKTMRAVRDYVEKNGDNI